MTNLLTLSYWFNLNPGPFLDEYIKIVYGIIVLILVAGFVTWIFVKKNADNKLIQKFWIKVQNFCFTIGISAGLLVFFRQQRINFLSMPFLLLLIFIGALVWTYFILKYITTTVPARKKEKAEQELKNKYL